MIFWNPLFCQKSALLILQCEVSHWHARGTSCLFPETDRLLKNSPKIVHPHNIPYSLPKLVERILCEWFPHCRRMWPSLCFLTYEIEIFCVLETLASTIPCFVLLSGDHTGNTVTCYNWVKELSSTYCINSWQSCSLGAFRSLVKQRGTNLAQIFCFQRFCKLLLS